MKLNDINTKNKTVNLQFPQEYSYNFSNKALILYIIHMVQLPSPHMTFTMPKHIKYIHSHPPQL